MMEEPDAKQLFMNQVSLYWSRTSVLRLARSARSNVGIPVPQR